MTKVAWLAGVMILNLALAGCAGDETDDGGTVATDDGAPTGSNETVDSLPTDVLEITDFRANVTTGQVPLAVTFVVNGTGAAGWSFDADGDGVAEENGTGLPANVTFVYEVAGTHNATIHVTDGNATVNQTVVITAEAGQVVQAPPPPPEGGHLESTTAGASVQAVIGRVSFTVKAQHPAMEIVTYLEDPLASVGGEDYVVRTTPPSGGNTDYTVGYGETITIEDPEVGTWEIGIFPVAAGAYTWTADWCAFTDVKC